MERYPGKVALYYQRENLQRVRRAVERLQQVHSDLENAFRYTTRLIEAIEQESESDEDL